MFTSMMATRLKRTGEHLQTRSRGGYLRLGDIHTGHVGWDRLSVGNLVYRLEVHHAMVYVYPRICDDKPPAPRRDRHPTAGSCLPTRRRPLASVFELLFQGFQGLIIQDGGNPRATGTGGGRKLTDKRLHNQRCLIGRCSGTGDLGHGILSSYPSSPPDTTISNPSATDDDSHRYAGRISIICLRSISHFRYVNQPNPRNSPGNQPTASVKSLSHKLGLTPWPGRAHNPL